MDIRALRYFVEVVNQNGFTKAALKLNVTQPTVSKMVQQLEQALEVALLAREGKRFAITDAGEIVLRRGREIIALHEIMKSEVRDLKKVEYGVLRLGLSPSTHTSLAPVLAAYHNAFPKIELKLFEVGSNAALDSLREGVLEIGTVLDCSRNREKLSEFDSMPLFESPLCLLAQRNSPWQGKTSVTLHELSECEFILYGDSFALNELVYDACIDAGFTPRVSGRSGQWDFMASLVSLGVGVTLLPRMFCETLDQAKFAIVDVSSPALTWKLSLAWRKSNQLSVAAKAWLTMAREMLPAVDLTNKI